LDRITYFNKNNFNIFFIFYKQKVFLKKIKYFFTLLNTFNQINFFSNYTTFLKKIKIKRGLIKYYFNGFLSIKPNKRYKLFSNSLNKQKKQLIQIPLIKNFKKIYFFNKSQSFLIALKPLILLTVLFKKIKIFHKKNTEIQLFCLKKNIYKKDSRYSINFKMK